MTAREMFEKLGYMCFNHGATVLYVNDSDDDEEIKSIKFNCIDFTFDVLTNYNESFRIDLALFDAIQTQMREWRWI
jgi:hypothetical protein